MSEWTDIGRDLAEAMPAPAEAGAQVAYGTVAAAAASTLSVRVGGAVLPSVAMTTACSGAKPGQRVLLLGRSPLWTAVGIIA